MFMPLPGSCLVIANPLYDNRTATSWPARLTELSNLPGVDINAWMAARVPDNWSVVVPLPWTVTLSSEAPFATSDPEGVTTTNRPLPLADKVAVTVARPEKSGAMLKTGPFRVTRDGVLLAGCGIPPTAVPEPCWSKISFNCIQ